MENPPGSEAEDRDAARASLPVARDQTHPTPSPRPAGSRVALSASPFAVAGLVALGAAFHMPEPVRSTFVSEVLLGSLYGLAPFLLETRGRRYRRAFWAAAACIICGVIAPSLALWLGLVLAARAETTYREWGPAEDP